MYDDEEKKPGPRYVVYIVLSYFRTPEVLWGNACVCLLFNALLAQQLVLLRLDLGVDLGASGRFVAVVSSLGGLGKLDEE